MAGDLAGLHGMTGVSASDLAGAAVMERMPGITVIRLGPGGGLIIIGGTSRPTWRLGTLRESARRRIFTNERKVQADAQERPDLPARAVRSPLAMHVLTTRARARRLPARCVALKAVLQYLRGTLAEAPTRTRLQPVVTEWREKGAITVPGEETVLLLPEARWVRAGKPGWEVPVLCGDRPAD